MKSQYCCCSLKAVPGPQSNLNTEYFDEPELTHLTNLRQFLGSANIPSPRQTNSPVGCCGCGGGGGGLGGGVVVVLVLVVLLGGFGGLLLVLDELMGLLVLLMGLLVELGGRTGSSSSTSP